MKKHYNPAALWVMPAGTSTAPEGDPKMDAAKAFEGKAASLRKRMKQGDLAAAEEYAAHVYADQMILRR
jgi:hypothetical protein